MEKTYTPPLPVVTPSYCPLVRTWSETKLTSGLSAVKEDPTDENTFLIHYELDLEPLGQTQVVTVSVQTSSRHGATSFLSGSRSFQLTFMNPCIDPTFVYLEAPILADIEYTIQ